MSIFKQQKFLSMASSVSGAVFGILIFALMARSLTKEDFGIFGVYLAIVTTFSMIKSGLVGKPVIKQLAETDSEEEQAVILGSAWRLSFYSSLIFITPLALVLGGLFWYYQTEEFLLYAVFSPLFALGTIPFNIATYKQNAEMRFDRLLRLRFMNRGLYFLGVLTVFLLDGGIWYMMASYLVASIIPSIVSIAKGWAGYQYLKHYDPTVFKGLVRFGRFTMGTLIGGTLLRSSDDFLIRIFLGPEGVALYQVPQRLVNLIDIPLRALVSFSYPSLAKANKNKDKSKFSSEFETSAGFAFVLLLPMAVGAFIFAEPLVVALGGAKYANTEAANLLRIFSVFMAFTSLDRYAGVALDVLNRPQVNLKKVIVMLSVNILGDIIVLYYFQDILWVAAISIITFSTGTILGFRYINDRVPLRFLHWVILGFKEIQRFVKKLVRKS